MDPVWPRQEMTLREAVFEAPGIIKVYRTGEVEVHALRGVFRVG